MTNLYEDDYPEGIADSAFDPTPEPFTASERATLGVFIVLVIAVVGYYALPLLKEAAVIVSWIVVGCFAYTFVCGVKEAIFG